MPPGVAPQRSRGDAPDWSDMSDHADAVKRRNPGSGERPRASGEVRVWSRPDDDRSTPGEVSRDVAPTSGGAAAAYPKGDVDPVVAAPVEAARKRPPQATFGRVRRANRAAPGDPDIHSGE